MRPLRGFLRPVEPARLLGKPRLQLLAELPLAAERRPRLRERALLRVQFPAGALQLVFQLGDPLEPGALGLAQLLPALIQ
jgi:hypothetical protein